MFSVMGSTPDRNDCIASPRVTNGWDFACNVRSKQIHLIVLQLITMANDDQAEMYPAAFLDGLAKTELDWEIGWHRQDSK